MCFVIAGLALFAAVLVGALLDRPSPRRVTEFAVPGGTPAGMVAAFCPCAAPGHALLDRLPPAGLGASGRGASAIRACPALCALAFPG